MTTKTQAKPKAAPVETPPEKRFRVTITTHKETIKIEGTVYLSVTLLDMLDENTKLIQAQGGYFAHGLDGHLKPTERVLRWIPLHMIEQVEVCEIVD